MGEPGGNEFWTAARGRRWLFAGLAVSVLAALWVLHRYNPGTHPFYPRCQIHALTGWHCPGCGAQRAVHALTHGDALAALRSNALLVLGAPALALWLAWSRRRGPVGTPPPVPGSLANRSAWAVAALVLLFTLLRNLPFGPFQYLAP